MMDKKKESQILNQFKSKLRERVTATRSAYFSHGKRKSLA